MSGESENTNRLVEWYRRHVGEPQRRVDVYLGFVLFVGGVALGLVGLGLFVVEQLVSGPEKLYWLREVAFAVGALGLPALLLGTVVLLPVDRRARYAAGAGMAVCLAAVAFFVSVYPRQWDVTAGTDYSMTGVAVYAVGLVTVVAATGAALVGYHVERAAPTAEDEPEESGPTVTEEMVRRDIDEAMAATDLSWGGVEKTDTKRLNLSTEAERDVDRSGFDGVEATTTRSDIGVDDAVSGLQGLKGGESRTETSGEDTANQAAALRELRAKQAAQAEDRGLLDRVRGWLGRD